MGTLTQQKEILKLREQLLTDEVTTEALRHTIDKRCRAMLLKVSPAGLKTVLVRRNHGENFFAAYLIDRTENRGWRVLVEGNRWFITRARRSATVLMISDRASLAHTQVMVLQDELVQEIERMLKCHTKSLKGSRARRLKKARRRSS